MYILVRGESAVRKGNRVVNYDRHFLALAFILTRIALPYTFLSTNFGPGICAANIWSRRRCCRIKIPNDLARRTTLPSCFQGGRCESRFGHVVGFVRARRAMSVREEGNLAFNMSRTWKLNVSCNLHERLPSDALDSAFAETAPILPIYSVGF